MSEFLRIVTFTFCLETEFYSVYYQIIARPMSQSYLSDLRAVIMEPGLGKARAQILSKQLEGKGGTTEQRLSETVTHVLVGNNVKLSRVLKGLEVDSLPAGVLVLRADWLSNCLVKGCKLDHTPYLVPSDDPVDPAPKTTSVVPLVPKHQTSPRVPPPNQSLLLEDRKEGQPPADQEVIAAAPGQMMTSSSEVSSGLCFQKTGMNTTTMNTTCTSTTNSIIATMNATCTGSTGPSDSLIDRSSQKVGALVCEV